MINQKQFYAQRNLCWGDVIEVQGRIRAESDSWHKITTSSM